MLRLVALGSLLVLAGCGGAEGYFSDRCNAKGVRYGTADHRACIDRNKEWLDWTQRRSAVDGRDR
jgi:hypothetical protein